MPPKLRGDAPPSASRRRWRYVGTLLAVHRDAVGGTLGHALKGQKLLAQGVWRQANTWLMREECAWFGTRMHVIRDNYCFSEKNVVSLHCHSLRTANGKLTTKKRRGKRQGCTPALSLSKCWTIKKRKEKENEKGSLENYLAGDYRRTYCRRHYARRYQLHVDWFV